MSDTPSSVIRARWALRCGLGFIWLYEGLVPKWLVPLTDLEKHVVAASGLVPNDFVEPFLRILGTLEMALGVCVLAGLWRRSLCVVQAAIVSAFTLVIPLTTSVTTVAHPFGLLSKNIPIIGAIVALWFLEGVSDQTPIAQPANAARNPDGPSSHQGSRHDRHAATADFNGEFAARSSRCSGKDVADPAI
jgi:uncharacterized membrane protein YphA (DoxX/SURF4 family)